MSARGWGLGLALLAASACKKEPPAAPVHVPRTTPLTNQPLNLAKPDEVRVRTDLSALRAAVRAQKQETGQFPPDLGSLGIEINYPADVIYHPETGIVRSRAYPMY